MVNRSDCGSARPSQSPRAKIKKPSGTHSASEKNAGSLGGACVERTDDVIDGKHDSVTKKT